MCWIGSHGLSSGQLICWTTYSFATWRTLREGRYHWHHNQVVAEIISKSISHSKHLHPARQTIVFIRPRWRANPQWESAAGNSKELASGPGQTTSYKKTLLWPALGQISFWCMEHLGGHARADCPMGRNDEVSQEAEEQKWYRFGSRMPQTGLMCSVHACWCGM